MFKKAGVLFFYTLTPLHPGSGASVGAVDLPIQRERYTGLPILQASGVKGALRDLAERRATPESEEVKIVFGPPTAEASRFGGALAVTDAHVLLFPVRSVEGVFAWITCPGVVARFLRDLEILRAVNNKGPDLLVLQKAAKLELADNECAVPEGGVRLKSARQVILEDFCFQVKQNAHSTVEGLAEWLSENALPSAVGEYWKNKLKTNLVMLNDNRFSMFTNMATEVITRIKLGETGTVEQGPWDEEHLPCETLLYALVLATDPKLPKEQQNSASIKDASQVIQFSKRTLEQSAWLMQFGGDETVGKGLVYVSFFDGGEGYA